MSKTYEEYKKILREYKGCPEENQTKLATALNLLLLEVMLDLRELIRDIRNRE